MVVGGLASKTTIHNVHITFFRFLLLHPPFLYTVFFFQFNHLGAPQFLPLKAHVICPHIFLLC